MSIIVFEDLQCEALSPITLARLAATISCGSYRLTDWLEKLDVPCIGMSRQHLREIQQHDFPILQELDRYSGDDQERPSLWLNARTVPSVANYFTLRELVASPCLEPRVVWDRDEVAAIVAPPSTLGELRRGGLEYLGRQLGEAKNWSRDDRKLELFQMPHEVISQNMSILHANLEERIQGGGYQQRQDGVFTAEDVTISDYVVLDTSPGPIVIEAGVKVGAYTLLRGPLYIGKKSRILEHAAIKDRVSIGHTTKIGGEVEASVIEPFTNKQHHGFLGHSYLGSWINLGAGTCNSDLKNTYGVVNMDYAFGKVATGMQFLGCIMGDYSKTAINTGIFTGKVIGVCSMMYGFVTSNVPSFVNYARLFGQMATLPPEVMVASQQRMFARRQVPQRDCDIRLIQSMYRLSQVERDRFGDGMLSEV